jgi:hypothetical protein
VHCAPGGRPAGGRCATDPIPSRRTGPSD